MNLINRYIVAADSALTFVVTQKRRRRRRRRGRS